MAMEMEQDVTPVEDEMGMDESQQSMFDGPIPGSSRTGELGAETHERPPMIVDPADAFNYVMDRIESPKAYERIVIAAKMDIPVELVVRSIVFSGWATGVYTQDVMLLIFGPILDMTYTLLDRDGIDYVPLAKRAEDTRLSEAMEKLSEYEGMLEDPVEEEETEEAPVEEETEEVPETGLMGRRE